MAYDVLNPDADLVSEERVLRRRRALLEQQASDAAAQRGIYAMPTPSQAPGWTSAVTGTSMAPQVIAPSRGAFVAPALAGVANRLEGIALDRQEQQLTRADREAAQRLMDEMPRAGMRPGPYGQDVPYEPTPAERVAWAQRAAQIPSLKPLADAYMSDQLIKQPERDEAREFRRSESQATREARAEENRLSREQRAELAANQERMRRELAADSNDLRRDLRASIAAHSGAGGSGSFVKAGVDPDTGQTIYFNPKTRETVSGPRAAETPLKPLPAAQAKAYLDNSTALAKLDDAAAALDTQGGKGATGFVKGAVNAIPGGDKVLNYFDSGGTATRALVSDIGSMKIHDRSGAAVTAAEFPRLAPFIPQIGDDRTTVKKKLANFRREYANAQQDIEDYAASMGYKVPVLSSRKAPTREASGVVTQGSAPVPGSSMLRMPALTDQQLLDKYR